MKTSPSSPAPKPLFLFLLQAGFLLALLGVILTEVEVGALALCAEGNAVFRAGAAGPGRSVRLEPVGAAHGSDVEMRGYADGDGEHRWRAVFGAHRHGIWPLAALLALLLATPMTGARRAWALPAGVTLQNALLMLHLDVLARVMFAAADARGEAALQRAVDLVGASFKSPVLPYALVFLIWAALARPARSIDLESGRRLLRRVLR